MKKIMIVGAGRGQLPAILKAIEKNVYVIAVDKNKDAIGMNIADESYAIDVIDNENIKRLAKKKQIDGIMTMQSDLPVPTVGSINEFLNFNGVYLQTAKNCSNKIFTRQQFEKYAVDQPKFTIASTIQEAKKACKDIGLPVVIKAPDSSGSRGITKINNLNQLDNAWANAKKYSRDSRVIVEEYIDGYEIGAQGFSVKGKCKKVLLHNDTLSNPPYMIPIGHSFPIVFDNKKTKKVELEIKRAINALGIENGPTNIDLIVSKKEEVKIVEIGARIGATCLPELVELFSGIDWVWQTIKNALGENVDLKNKFEHPIAAIIIESQKDGVFKDFIIPSEVWKHPNLIDIEVTSKPGHNVSIFRKGTDRIGKILTSGSTSEEAERIAETLREKVKIIVE